jgi:hypothetical protein
MPAPRRGSIFGGELRSFGHQRQLKTLQPAMSEFRPPNMNRAQRNCIAHASDMAAVQVADQGN